MRRIHQLAFSPFSICCAAARWTRWLAGASCLIAASSANAAQLVANADADAKFKVMEQSIYLYGDKPYTIAEAVAKNEVAGLSLVIIHDGKPAIHRTYGYRIEKKRESTTDKTIYQCASMSKMVSSLGVVTAARRGELQLDQPVTEFNRDHPNTLLTRWVDEYFKNESAAWDDDITLRRLLSHSAGIDVHGIMAAPWLPSKEPLESIIFGKSIFKDAAKPIHAPGTKYKYSGGGYTVAEAWLEIATGRKFKDYLKQHVLDPLGLTQSTYETGDEDTPHLAWG
jgi:CubicO group peptidase (beta-lactamase class C family)